MEDWGLSEMLGGLARDLARVALHDLGEYARGKGLTLAQLNVLIHLNGGPMEIGALRETMQASPAAASQMVDRMATRGLVRRSEVPDDRRVRLVELTPRGRRLVAGSAAASWARIDGLVAELSARDRESFASVLAALAARLDDTGGGEMTEAGGRRRR